MPGKYWRMVGGKCGHPGSCALNALPDVQEGHVWTSWARYYQRGYCGGLDDQFGIARGRRGRFG
jgi:hypothetical protein